MSKRQPQFDWYNAPRNPDPVYDLGYHPEGTVAVTTSRVDGKYQNVFIGRTDDEHIVADDDTLLRLPP